MLGDAANEESSLADIDAHQFLDLVSVAGLRW
jgi:hypothetical protein